MKKLLALVLAMVMTLGLATVSTGAAYDPGYKDKSDIEYTEASNVLSRVGVFQGKGENFAPKDNLNRAEAAKLIAYLMLGNKTAEDMKGNGNKFTDVPADHYAAGYIEYLATAGIVSGVGDGKYNPNGQVTAVQFAKMLCVALGYDAQVEGYVGNSWNINIMKQANKDKIFDLIDGISTNDVLTREQAAQMCLNALKADMVEYESKGDTLTINNSTVVLNAKKAKTKTTTETKGKNIKQEDGATGSVDKPWTLQLGEDLYKGDLKKEKSHDDFGRPSNKWIYKNEEIGNYENKSDLRATYTDELKRGPLYDLLGKSVYDHLVLNSSDDHYAELYYYEDNDGGLVNNAKTTTTTSDAAANKTNVEKFIQKDGDDKINSDKSSGRGTVTEVFVDDNDNTTIVVINTYVYKAASDYRASSEDIVISVPSEAKDQGMNLNSTRLELVDFPEIKDFKKDDYLLITAYKDGNNYKAKTVEKAELLTGKVEKVVVTDSVTIDGQTLKYSKKATDDTKDNDFSVGQDTTVVLDKYGFIIYVDESVVANNYVFISELFQTGGSTTKVKANAYFTDGTNAEITVKEAAGQSGKSTLVGFVGDDPTIDTDKASAVAGVLQNNRYVGWYSYSKNSAGEYTLNALSSSYTQGGYTKNYTGASPSTELSLTKSDTVSFIDTTSINTLPGGSAANSYVGLNSVSASSVKANDKTIMIVTYGDKNDVDIYTGVKNMPDIKFNGSTDGHGAVFAAMKDGYAKYVFASVDGPYTVFGTESENLLYVIKYDKKNTTTDNKNYYTYKALDENAKEITIEAENQLKDGSTTLDGTVYTSFYKTSKNTDGRYTSISVVPANTVGQKYFKTSATRYDAITAEGNTLNIAGESFTLADDYKLIVVSQDDDLNKLKGKDYEANLMSAEGLEAMVKGYYVGYTAQFKLKDGYDGAGKGGKILEGYVTISSADAKTDMTVSIAKALGDVTVKDNSGSDTEVKNVGLGNVYYVTKDTTATTIKLTLNAVTAHTVDMSVNSGYTINTVGGTPVNDTKTGTDGYTLAAGDTVVVISRAANVSADGTLTVKAH